MNEKMSFDEMREAMLYHRIVEWNENRIKLDNGMELTIEETEQDCCACASGKFVDVVLDAAITEVGNIVYKSWEDGDTYGCSATVTIMHNKNIICKATADANAGNGGYYYSIASFIVKMPHQLNSQQVHFVSSHDN